MPNLDPWLSSRAAFILLLVTSYGAAFILLRPLMIVDAFGYMHLYGLCLIWALIVAALAVWHPRRVIWSLPQFVAPLEVAQFVQSQEGCPEWLRWCIF